MNNTNEVKELALMMIVTLLSVSAACMSSSIIVINSVGVVISICAWVLMLVLGISSLLFIGVSAAEYVGKAAQMICCGSSSEGEKQSSDMSVIT